MHVFSNQKNLSAVPRGQFDLLVTRLTISTTVMDTQIFAENGATEVHIRVFCEAVFTGKQCTERGEEFTQSHDLSILLGFATLKHLPTML